MSDQIGGAVLTLLGLAICLVSGPVVYRERQPDRAVAVFEPLLGPSGDPEWEAHVADAIALLAADQVRHAA